MARLHRFRFQLLQKLQYMRVRTGDLFFRTGNDSYYGLPFSRIIANVTKSKWSHASVAVVRNGEIRLIEVALQGTQELRFVDWIDMATDGFAVWRIKDEYFSQQAQKRLEEACEEFLKQDSEYNLQFNYDPTRHYCTESADFLYRKAGFAPLCAGTYAREVMSPYFYKWVFKPINWFMKMATGASIPENEPLIAVGNENIGLCSSVYLEPIFEFTL